MKIKVKFGVDGEFIVLRLFDIYKRIETYLALIFWFFLSRKMKINILRKLNIGQNTPYQHWSM